MKITYKYKIGQKVKLTKLHYLNSYYLDDNKVKKILDKEVTIINRGFDYGDGKYGGPINRDKLKLTIFYYIAEDPTERHTTMYYESAFEGEVFNETVDEQTVSADGVEVEIGTKLYDHVLLKEHGKLRVNTTFTFASEGPCVRIRKNYRHWDSSYDPLKVEDEFIFDSCREFLCQMNIDGKVHDCGDSRRYGNRSGFYSTKAYTKLPENFAELYVDTILDKKSFYGRTSMYDNIWSWEIEQWLNHFGVWEQVKELYDKRTSKKPKTEKPKKKKDDKLTQLLANLSEEERKKLKEML